MSDKARSLFANGNGYLSRVLIVPDLTVEPDWREQAKAYLRGEGVTNQGRVRSDNIAGKLHDGLLFRSNPEINLYNALKQLSVAFAPLPVFIKGGREYKRIEPDFIVLRNGVVLHVEVDGDMHNESPVDAHERTSILHSEGAIVERVKAAECATMEGANKCARKLLGRIDKHKANL